MRSLEASVVVPTHGRRGSLVRVLGALNNQTTPVATFEVIVVCDGDIDGSEAACRDLAPTLAYRLRVFTQSNQGPAAARNRGIGEAAGRLIIFLDDDVVPDSQLVSAHLAVHRADDKFVTIGPLLPPPDVRLTVWAAWEENELCRQYEDMAAGKWEATYRQFYTGNAAVARRYLADVGDFDSRYTRAEDIELALRLRDRGLRFSFLPEARGWHYVSRSFKAWLETPHQYGVAAVAMSKTHPEVLRILAKEYPHRHPLTRGLVAMTAGRPRALRRVLGFLGYLVRVTNAAGAMRVGNVLCSALFNVSYYGSIIHSLGDRKTFANIVTEPPSRIPWQM